MERWVVVMPVTLLLLLVSVYAQFPLGFAPTKGLPIGVGRFSHAQMNGWLPWVKAVLNAKTFGAD